MREAYERLKWAREQRFESAAEAARALGIEYPTYAGHENGSRGFNKEATKYAKKFGVSLLWLMSGQGSPKPGMASEVQEIFDQIPPDRRPVALRLLKSLLDE